MIRSIKKMFKSNYLFTLGVIICLAWILLAIVALFTGLNFILSKFWVHYDS